MRVLKYLPKKLFGFVVDDEGQQVFFHIRAFKWGDFPTNPPPIIGEEVDVEYDEGGHSRRGDEYIVNVPLETKRVDRIAIRLSSGGVMRGCVKYGYIIGLDDATKARGKKDLLAFLERSLGASRDER